MEWRRCPVARGAKNPRAQATQLLRMPGTKILYLTLGGKEAGVGMGWKGELVCSLGWRESKPMQVREPLLTLTLPPHLFRSLRRWLCQRTLFQASPSPRPCATFSPQQQECCLQAVSLTLTDMACLWTKGVPGYTPVGLTVQGWHLHLHSHRQHKLLPATVHLIHSLPLLGLSLGSSNQQKLQMQGSPLKVHTADTS